MVERWQVATFLVVLITIVITVVTLTILQVTPSVSNAFELSYANIAHLFVPKVQISYFTDAFYPINNKVPTSYYTSAINGTAQPQLVSLNRYIASIGTSAFPLTTTAPVISTTLVTPYASSLSTLIYASNPLNLPNPNTTFYYVYPLYEVSYNVNCTRLTPSQQSQIQSITAMIKYSSFCTAKNSTFSYTALVGTSNNTATIIDGIYTLMNPLYKVGSQNFLQPLSVYNTNGSVVSTNNAINGTLLGYSLSTNTSFTIFNRQNLRTNIAPVRNIFKGNLYTGQVMLAGLYCWSSAYISLTNYLQTQGYTQYPYLYQFNNTNYLCLTVNSTDTILNASSNLDGSNFKLAPTIFNGTLFSSFPNYVIANSVAIGDTYQYLTIGAATTVSEKVTNKQFWFLPNTTNIFSLAKSPNYVFTEFTATQYLLSTTLPILGQEPPYTAIKVNTTYTSLPIIQQALVTSATTYLYGPLTQNLTYQYITNESQTGTPVYCISICDYNGSLVYAQASYAATYPYQWANRNFGYVEIPKLNQTVYYNPEIAVIAQTPLRNDTNVRNVTFGQYCLVVNQFQCQYHLSAAQVFGDVHNYTAFIIYGEGQNSTFYINGFQLTGWTNVEKYLNNLTVTNKLATISYVGPTGVSKWAVVGIVENVNPDYIVMSPQSFEINPGAYPNARPLTYSTILFVVFFAVIFFVAGIGYVIASVKLQEVLKR